MHHCAAAVLTAPCAVDGVVVGHCMDGVEGQVGGHTWVGLIVWLGHMKS